MNYLDTPEESKRRGWANDEKDLTDLWERHLTDDKSFLRQTSKRNLRIAPGKQEESGNILGKDLLVMGPLKRNTVERFKRENAPVRFKWLEWDNSLEIGWTDLERQDEPSEISSALGNNWIVRGEWLWGATAWESIWNEGKRDMINKAWIGSTGEENEWGVTIL